MKEDFLHYLWKFQKFTTTHFISINQEHIQVLKPGIQNSNQGPDFLMAQLVIDGQEWVGTVEIHVRSSHWYQHGHETDANYESVILHVVWEHDVEIFRNDNSIIPTLEIATLVAPSVLKNYQRLQATSNNFLVCKEQLNAIPDIIFEPWVDSLFVERMTQKSVEITKRLMESQYHWEAILFERLASGFGLHINANSFSSIVQSIPFSEVQKTSQETMALEALLMGQAGLLEKNGVDDYYIELQVQYHFLKRKFKLQNETIEKPNFFRLRPANFPTIRLSQLANLWSKQRKLFTLLMQIKTKEAVYQLLQVRASPYWDSHYTFGVITKPSKKLLSKSFIDLLIINTIIPFQFAYQKALGITKDTTNFDLALSMNAEKNAVVQQFKAHRTIKNTAIHSQALLQLKKEYCDVKKCTSCRIGNHILSS